MHELIVARSLHLLAHGNFVTFLLLRRPAFRFLLQHLFVSVLGRHVAAAAILVLVLGTHEI
jgi:hypothetical protein